MIEACSNLITAAQAGERTCPMTFQVAEMRAPDGSGVREAGPWGCIGPNCMAWRWGKKPAPGSDAFAARPTVPDPEHGYCGAFGAP